VIAQAWLRLRGFQWGHCAGIFPIRLQTVATLALPIGFAGLLALNVAPAAAEPCPNQALRTGPSAALPDCRAYEQVSSPEKGGLDAISLHPLYPSQSTACSGAEPCSILYMSASAAFGGAAANELPDAYVATRRSEDWSTFPLPPAATGPPVNGTAQFTYVPSADLSEAVLKVPLQQLTPGAPAGVYNLYLRHSDGSYALITTVPPPTPPTAGCGSCFETQDVPAFAGASSDFNYILFEANDALTEGAPGGEVDNLYETEMASGQVNLVGVLPDGTIPTEGSSAGGGIEPIGQKAGSLEHDISADGSHVLFQAKADAGAPDPEQAGKTELYDRIDGSSTVEVSAPAPGAQPSNCETKEGICNAEPAQFQSASADGSLVYFTSSAALTRESNTGSEQGGENPGVDLYRYDVSTATWSDLTVDDNPEDPNGADVLGILGASSDGSYLYFVARGQLAAGASSGQPNLYEWHGGPEGPGATTFIATLGEPTAREVRNAERMRAGNSFPYNSDLLDWAPHPSESQAYVTPDGKHLAFMSVNPLTGYDNTDQFTGEPDHEVFSYDAETAHLACASCDPSGARPRGSAFIGARLTERVSTPFHQPRTISDDGSRLFFSSPDPLVPGTPPGHVKVFEYEEGAIHLISAATSASDDVFLDASASGDDVFFTTRAALAPTDDDELADVYDARVDGGFAPPPSSSAPCIGDSCQGPPSPPPTWPSPSSASSGDSGNLPRRARSLASCKRLRSRARRAKCLARARRRRRTRAGHSDRAVAALRARSHGPR
jgi:hypothetical protein